MLKKMGANVVITDQSFPNCFLLCRHDDRHNGLFVQDISATEHCPKGVVYIGTKHRPMISILINDLEQLLGPNQSSKPKLILQESDPKKLISLLKEGVHQYNDPGVTIKMQAVSLKRESELPVRMIVRRVRSFKYRQVEYLASLYNQYNIPFCKPADILADGEYVSTVTPPVLEEWGDDLIAIEGNTRLFYLNRNGWDSIHCLVVKGVTHPLPGRPVYPHEALLSTYHLPSNERISGFMHEHFRSIEGAVRPPVESK